MNDSAASEQSRPAAGPGAGALLLAERRRQGLSLGDISRQLKLSVRQVEALERDDYGVFRSPVFVHGFIRNYAKLLGMQAGPLIAQADSLLKPVETAKAQAEAATLAATETRSRRKVSGLGRIAGGFSLVVLLVAIVYMSVGGKNGDAPPPAVVSTPPAQELQMEAAVVAAPQAPSEAVNAEPAAVSAPEATASGGAVIRMVFDQESWVEIKDGNGNTIFGQLMSAGSRRSVTGEPPLSVVIGNADGVQLSYKAKVVDLAPHTRVNVARLTLE